MRRSLLLVGSVTVLGLGAMGACGSSSSTSTTAQGGSSTTSTLVGPGSTTTGTTSASGGATSTSTTMSTSTSTASGGSTSSGGGGLFEPVEPWTRDISGLPKDGQSDTVIGALKALGGWGNGNVLQIDFSIILLHADMSTPRQTITADPGGYCYGGTDCDAVPLQMPLPANGNTEGSADYNCDTANNDCHVLVVEKDEKKLYELYSSTKSGTDFTALGAFVWDLTKAYPDNERGDQCTSADAAGLPISGLLVTADEVASGEVKHAIRFILPNDHMRNKVYVHPASHAGDPKSANPNAPPYGVRFRLAASFDDSSYTAPQKVVLAAMKKYGMILSDGGKIALTFGDDRLDTAKWATLGITAQTFNSIGVDNFEVVDLGPDIPVTNDCVRN